MQLAHRPGVTPSTVHRILTSCHLHCPAHVDRPTSEPIDRYEHDHPDTLLHVDVKKIGTTPNRGKGASSTAARARTTRPPLPTNPGPNTTTRTSVMRSSTLPSPTTRASSNRGPRRQNRPDRHNGLIRAVEWFNPTGRHCRAGPFRQRQHLPRTPLAPDLGSPRDHREQDTPPTSHRPPATSTDSTAPNRRLGLHPLQRQRNRTSQDTRRLGPLHQSAPRHLLQQPATILAIDQRPRSVQLGVVREQTLRHSFRRRRYAEFRRSPVRHRQQSADPARHGVLGHLRISQASEFLE